MKKLLVALLFLPSIAGAAWVSTNGSTVTATIEDGVGNKITSTTNALDVNLKSGVTTVTGSTVTLQGSNGAGVTATSGALDINIKSGSIGNASFGISGSLPAGTAALGTVVVSSMGVIDISGNSKSVGYASQNSSVPVNVLNTINAAQSGTWNVGTVTTLTGITNALPTGTNNIGTVSGSTTVIQGSNGGGITATAGALDMNIKSGSIGNTGFNVTGSLPAGAAAIGTVVVSSMGVIDISGVSRSVGYASMNSSVPVNVINTPAVSQSGTWNVGTVTTLTGITNALPAGTNNIGTIGNLNGVVISSFAATSTPQVNLTQIATTTVATAGGNAGELRISAEVSGTSNTFQGGLAHDGAAAATNRLGTLPAVAQTTFANGTVLTAGRNEGLSVGTDGLLWVASHPPMRPASFYASASSASYTSTTDMACLPGNATNTVIVRKIAVSCTETTAGQVTVSILRRSSADSSGTSASMLVGKDDSTSGSAVSVPLVYSAAPTKGTLDSVVDVQTIGCMASATASPNDVLIENWNDKAKVLRGTAQEFCVSLAAPQDLAGTTVTGGNFNVNFQWDEISSITP